MKMVKFSKEIREEIKKLILKKSGWLIKMVGVKLNNAKFKKRVRSQIQS